MYSSSLIYKKRKKYKYTLHKRYCFDTNIKPINSKMDGLFHIHSKGLIEALPGYSWDGPSGPTIDTPSFMTGSLIHDILYQLMREGYINIKNRKKADIILREKCIADGMFKFRAWIVYYSVRLFGKRHAELKSDLKYIIFGVKIND